jgi:hypothetical protein
MVVRVEPLGDWPLDPLAVKTQYRFSNHFPSISRNLSDLTL